MVSFVLPVMTREFHTFFSKLKTTRALLILTLMSSSVPPFTLTVLPRYTNDEISSRYLSLILIGLLDVQLIFMILVLPTLGFSPSLAECFIILVVLFCICWLCQRAAQCHRPSRDLRVVSVGSTGCRFVVYLWSPSLSNRSPAGTRMVTSSSLVLRLSLLQNYVTISQQVSFIVQSIASRNKNGDIKQPCFTPVFTAKLSDNFPA